MKTLTSVVVLALVLVLPAFSVDDLKPHTVIPKEGLVPNEQTAIAIAVAIWIPIYGQQNIDKQKPFKAWLKDGVWHVAGNLPKNMVGGVAIAEIQKTDAKVIRVSHGK